MEAGNHVSNIVLKVDDYFSMRSRVVPSLFRHLSSRSHFTDRSHPQPSLKFNLFQSLQFWHLGCVSPKSGGTYALFKNPCPSHPDCRFAERSALCTCSGLHQYRSRAGLPVWLLRLRPIQLRPIWVLRSRVV